MERKRKEPASPFGSSDRPVKRLRSAGEDSPKEDADQAKNGKHRSRNPDTVYSYLRQASQFSSTSTPSKTISGKILSSAQPKSSESMVHKRKEPASPFGSSDRPEKRHRSAGKNSQFLPEDVGHVAGARGGYHEAGGAGNQTHSQRNHDNGEGGEGLVAGEVDDDVMVGRGVNVLEERNNVGNNHGGESEQEFRVGEQGNDLAPEVARQHHQVDCVIDMGDRISEDQGGNDGYDHHVNEHDGEIDQQLVVGEKGNGIAQEVAERTDDGGYRGQDINTGEDIGLGNRASADAQMNPGNRAATVFNPWVGFSPIVNYARWFFAIGSRWRSPRGLEHLFLFISISLFYLCVGGFLYTRFHPSNFSGKGTAGFLAGAYFSSVTITTVGYGDIVPNSPLAQLMACLYLLVGLAILSVIVSDSFNRVLHAIESKMFKRWNPRTGCRRAVRNLFPTFLLVTVLVGINVLVVRFSEHLTWWQSVYMSIISVTSTGFGDLAFMTPGGRGYATFWLLVSTLAVVRYYSLLAQTRIDLRAESIIRHPLTSQDIFDGCRHENGSVSELEYLVYMLKKTERVDENDITQIRDRFRMLDGGTGAISIEPQT